MFRQILIPVSSHITKVDRVLTERHRYDEIRCLCINQLAFIWTEGSTTEVDLNKKIDSFLEGDLEDGAEVLSALWEILNSGNISPPLNTSPHVSPSQFFLLPGAHGDTYFAR